jgi:ABC-type nitrate/sulfonate/bicarbonate transport system substrate-binding protein
MRFFGGLILVLLLAAISGLYGCGNPRTSQSIHLRIGVVGTISTLPYYVMRDKGFDQQNGLIITEQTYQSGNSIIDAVAEGTVDGSPCGGSVNILLAKQKGTIPEKVVVVSANAFADREHPVTGVIAANFVNGWKDLEGWNIGVPSKTSMFAAAISSRLHIEGVKNFTLIEISISNTGLAVASGNIAAGVMAEPYITQSILRKDGKFLDWVIGGKPFEKIEYSANIFNSGFIKNSPEAVKAYLRAHRQACLWIGQNPGDTRIILGRKLALTSGVVNEVKMMYWPADMRNDPVSLNAIQPALIDIGALKALIPAGELYNEKWLDEVLAETR